MKEFPTTITAENFNDAANFVSIALAKTKRKTLIRRLIKPIGGIIFLFLSFLLVFGAFFKFSSPEDILVFIKLEPLTNIWKDFSGLFTTEDMAWYIYWPILIVAAFVIPIIVSAIITIIVSLCYKAKPVSLADGSEAEKAKALHQAASKIKAGSYESDYYEVGFTAAFIACLAALIVYAFVILKLKFEVGLIVGAIIAGFIVFWIYSIIFLLFASFNGKFYQIKDCGNITTVTDAYWLSVDPEEVARRKEIEEQRAKESAQNKAKGAEKRIQGLAEERSGNYSRAKQLFREAAYLGDALGMDNYARHCLINGNRSDAIYWLQKSINTGEADETSRSLLQALKNGEHIDVHYN